MVKLADEVLGVASAIEQSGTFASHHRDDLEQFVDQLTDHLEDHTEYEEQELFPAIADQLDPEARSAVDRAVEQHRDLEEHVAAFAETVDAVEEGDDAGEDPVRQIIREAEAIAELVEKHGEVEERIFESLEPDDSSAD